MDDSRLVVPAHHNCSHGHSCSQPDIAVGTARRIVEIAQEDTAGDIAVSIDGWPSDVDRAAGTDNSLVAVLVGCSGCDLAHRPAGSIGPVSIAEAEDCIAASAGRHMGGFHRTAPSLGSVTHVYYGMRCIGPHIESRDSARRIRFTDLSP